MVDLNIIAYRRKLRLLLLFKFRVMYKQMNNFIR